WAGAKARAAGDLRTAGHALVSLAGDAAIAVADVRAGKSLREAPIALDLDVPGLDLATLTPIEGKVRGHLAVKGRLDRPELSGHVIVAGLRRGTRGAAELALDLRARADGARATAQASLRQAGGGHLDLDVDLPLREDDAARPPHARVVAEEFDLGFC